MFNKETYIQRRNRLKKEIGKGILLFLGNNESGIIPTTRIISVRIRLFYIFSVRIMPVFRL